MKRLAIIPARAGSKGLKDKNIIDLCGKPMIAYSIEAALKSCLFEKVIVTTDSKKYGDIAKAYGADVIYRGDAVSDDKASTYMVISDLFRRLEDTFDYFVLLQPTSPLRNEVHVREAVKLFEDKIKEYHFLVSVQEAEFAGVLVKPIEEDCSMKHFDTDFSSYKRQLYKEYSPNGAIYIGKVAEYLQQGHFYGAKAIAYRMAKEDSIDIDDELDYALACYCMKRRINLCTENTR